MPLSAAQFRATIYARRARLKLSIKMFGLLGELTLRRAAALEATLRANPQAPAPFGGETEEAA